MCLLNRMLAIVGAATPVAMTIALVCTSIEPRDQRAGLSDDESVDRLLYGIVQNDSAQVKRALHVANLDVNARDRLGVTPLIVAIMGGGENSQASMNLLIRAGADLNCADNFGMTPIMHAVVAQNDQAVQILLENGAENAPEAIEGPVIR